MSKAHITSATTTPITDSPATKVFVQVNADLTGTITVNDGATAVAVITDPTVGTQFEYWDFTKSVSVVTSASCDITVSTYGGYGNR